MATNNLLTDAAPDYRKFVDNQVLTDDQLNAALDHLDYQDQLSRVLLSGVGIVCGLNISMNQDKEGQPGIHLSKGAAVTTAGNLLKSEDRNFKGFKEFKDREVQYPRFTDIEGQTLPLWELETNIEPSDVYSLDQFKTTTDIALDDAVAVLYLEDYLHEREECSPVDCDTQGREVIKNIRVLLIDPGYATGLSFGDTIFSQRMTSDDRSFLQLSHLYTPRVVLNEAKAANYEAFKKAYRVSFSDIASRIIELGSLQVFTDLREEIGIDPEEELENFSVTHTNIQYLYDFYKDLVTACNELSTLLKKNFSVCCPDPEAFPKHVLLGPLSNQESKWRHGFYPSPTHNQRNSIATMQAAFKRILLMVEHFNPAPKDEIIITPSRGSDAQLGKRAVPFYYDLEAAEKAHEFLEKWRSDRNEVVLNYYGFDYPSQNFDPLRVCLDDHDFYRIEGHAGGFVMEAHRKLQQLKKEKGLAFDIKPVAVGKYADAATIDYEKYRVYFEDLQVVLQAWNEEQECMIEEATQFLSGFSTKVEGKHTDYTPKSDTTLLNEVYIDSPEYVATFVSDKETISEKQLSNTVTESFVQTKDTTGLVMKDLVQADFDKFAIQVNLTNRLRNLMLDWDQDIKAAALNIPARLIGYLKETEDYKLTDIEDFTEENLKKYITALQAQCKQVRQAKKQFQQLIPRLKQKDNKYVKPWIKQYEYILNRIASSCCMIKKIEVLYQKIMERKKKLLGQLVLDQFVEDHPGAEHKAGVERGGTFVLLYYSNNKKPGQNNLIYRRAIPFNVAEGTPFLHQVHRSDTQSESVRPKVDPQSLKPQNLSIDQPRMEIKDLPKHIAEENINLPRMGRNPRLDFRHLPSSIFGDISPVENLPHGTVIGDLCLPYICCSDVPPTQFVFPDQLAELRLPTDHICMDEKDGADSIPLNVKPADGDVKAFIQKRELSGVITVNQIGSYFVPNEVPKEDYDKPIRFEVNGQPVDPELRLYRKPQPNFSVEDTTLFKENTIARVTFKNLSPPTDKLLFEWDFDGEVKKQEGVKELNYHKFPVKPGQNNEFKVRLTAFNGPCRATHTQTVKINLEKPDEDCEDIVLQKIRNSRKSIENDLDEHPDVLDNLRKTHYESDEDKDLLKNIFEKIIKNDTKALEGDYDEEILPFISRHQLLINKEVYGGRSNIEQKFKLKLYFELMLLYFYIQICRDSNFAQLKIITSGERSWEPFTELATTKFSEAFSSLLEEHKILENLLWIQKKAKLSSDNTLSKVLTNIIDKLKKFLDQ